MSAVVAAIAAACALLLGAPTRLPPAGAEPRVPAAASETAVLRRLRMPLAALAGFAGWAFLGGAPGALGGAVAAAVAWRVLGNVQDPAVARREAQLERDLPVAVYLMGAALRAGTAPDTALLAVADAVGGPVGEDLAAVHHRLHLGVDPVQVWGAVGGGLRPLGRAMVRSLEAGASALAAVSALAEDLRAGSRARTEALARTVEVRAAAPLGLCFLPAFVLVGVVPMTVGIFSSIELLG